MDKSDENLLDSLGTIAVLVGAVVVLAAVFDDGLPVLEALKATQPLFIGGIAAVVGGGAVKTYLRK